MLRIVLAAAVLAAVVTVGPRQASASGPAPWCAVTDIGWQTVVSDCSYWSFEACVDRVLGGNRGFCEPNPNFRGPVERSRRDYYRYRPRR